jgi:hypothetical protein
MAVRKNNIGLAVVFGFVLVAPLAPKDPPVAATMGFFLDDWQPKNWVASGSREDLEIGRASCRERVLACV